MYARPASDHGTLHFGVSGKLWREVLVLYDRQTRSLWSQRENRAIAGPLGGSELEVLESTLTDWASWRGAHPATTVVIQPRVPFLSLSQVVWLLATLMVGAGIVLGRQRRKRAR